MRLAGGGAGSCDPPASLSILIPLRLVVRCNIGGTNSHDCPIPASTGKCLANLECVATAPPPSSPPSANKACKRLKKSAKKQKKKWKMKEHTWEKKCS